MADHVHAAAEGSGIPEDVMGAMVDDRHLADPDVTIYVGYTDGEPVSAGLGLRTGRTIGVYNIATVERARRRGLGAAMTARVVADGAAAGCDVAILHASPMGFADRIASRVRTVVEYVGWSSLLLLAAAARRGGRGCPHHPGLPCQIPSPRPLASDVPDSRLLSVPICQERGA